MFLFPDQPPPLTEEFLKEKKKKVEGERHNSLEKIWDGLFLEEKLLWFLPSGSVLGVCITLQVFTTPPAVPE